MNYRVIVWYTDTYDFEGYGWYKLRAQAAEAAEKLEAHFPGRVKVINYRGFTRSGR